MLVKIIVACKINRHTPFATSEHEREYAIRHDEKIFVGNQRTSFESRTGPDLIQ